MVIVSSSPNSSKDFARMESNRSLATGRRNVNLLARLAGLGYDSVLVVKSSQHGSSVEINDWLNERARKR
jgi:hypothetical protein